jgi:hypothetical protein
LANKQILFVLIFQSTSKATSFGTKIADPPEEIQSDHWYGPGNQSTPAWPLTSDPFKYSASMSRHFDAGTFSSAIDYHWISSGGSAIFVPNDVALEVDWNIRTNKICLFAKYSGDFYGSHTEVIVLHFSRYYWFCHLLEKTKPVFVKPMSLAKSWEIFPLMFLCI